MVPRRDRIAAAPRTAACLLGGALAIGSAVASAAPAPATLGAPAGWQADRGDARTRLAQWLGGRTDARILEVHSPSASDDFAEILALVEIDGAFVDDVAPEQQLTAALVGLPGADALDTTTIVATSDAAEPRVQVAWRDEPLAFRAELVATGDTRTLLLQVTLAREAALYARTFDDARAAMRGAAAPVRAFDTGRWRLHVALSGLALLVGFGVLLWRKPLGTRGLVIGRVGAIAVALVATVAAWWTASTLAPQAESLARAGASPDRLAGEIAIAGLVAALGCWIAGQLSAAGDAPVASAPVRGAFADRSSPTLTSNPVIPQLPRQSERPRRTHPDGPSQLASPGDERARADDD